MKCPYCVAEGMRSTVTEEMRTRTAMGIPSQQWDEDGNPLPRVDPNFSTIHYSCSNGHRWSKEEK